MWAQVRAHNEFTLAMRVTGFISGKSVHQAGLRMLPSAFLVAIERRGTTINAVSPDEVLEVDDILWFAGVQGGMFWVKRNRRKWVKCLGPLSCPI
jgi:hypothetical protein